MRRCIWYCVGVGKNVGLLFLLHQLLFYKLWGKKLILRLWSPPPPPPHVLSPDVLPDPPPPFCTPDVSVYYACIVQEKMFITAADFYKGIYPFPFPIPTEDKEKKNVD